MRKFLFNLRTPGRISWIHTLTILVFLILLQSCDIFNKSETELQASLDRCNYTYSGDSYYQVSQSEHDFGFNISYIFMTSPGKNWGTNSHFSNDRNAKNIAALYAGHATGHGPFYNNIADDEENVVESYNDKSTSSLKDHIGFRGGLELIQKKAKDGDTKTILNFLEIPVSVIYQAQLNPAGRIFGGVGPYIGYGIAGKIKSAGTSTKAFQQNEFKRFDAGLDILAGYQLTDGWAFTLCYEKGLVNIEDDPTGTNKTKPTVISLSVGYDLNKLIHKKNK